MLLAQYNNCVSREEVWNCLRLKSLPETYIQLMQDMYEGSTTYVRCMNDCSEPFAVTVKVHQGLALSPFVLVIFMDCRKENIRRARWKTMFADEVFLCTSTREEFQIKLEIWTKALEERGMKISRKNTE